MFLETSGELLRSGISVRFRAGGQSMHPTIRDGELITVEPIAHEKIRRGDIVLYRFKRGVIAHRVVRIDKPRDSLVFTLRGDAMPASDAPVKAEAILGRVIFVERAGRLVKLVGRRARLTRSARMLASRIKAKSSHR